MPSLADQLYAIAQMDAREQADQYVVGEGVRVIFLGFSLDCQRLIPGVRRVRTVAVAGVVRIIDELGRGFLGFAVQLGFLAGSIYRRLSVDVHG